MRSAPSSDDLLAGGGPGPYDSREGRPAIVRLKQITFRSQIMILLALATPTAIVIFAVLLLLDLAGVELRRSTREISLPVMVLAYLTMGAILAAGIALLQVAGLGLRRLLRLRGPALEIEGDTTLERIFD